MRPIILASPLVLAIAVLAGALTLSRPVTPPPVALASLERVYALLRMNCRRSRPSPCAMACHWP